MLVHNTSTTYSSLGVLVHNTSTTYSSLGVLRRNVVVGGDRGEEIEAENNVIILLNTFAFSGSEEKGGSIFGRFPAFSNTSERCYTLTVSPDNIVGNDRQFTVRLDVDESSYPTGVMLRHPTATVSIQDTSE